MSATTLALGDPDAPPSLGQRWRTAGTILAICLAERMTYRTDFLLGTFMRFLPIVTTIFLWRAIFAGSDRPTIAGFTPKGIVAYFLLTMVARAFSSMPGLAGSMAGDIRGGAVKKYITQPVDWVSFLFLSRVAHKLVYYAFALFPFAVVFWLCRDYFEGWPRAEVTALFIVSLFLGFAIGFLFDVLIGLSAFWLLEIGSLSFVIMLLIYALSGHMFPLDLAPEPWATVAKCLPFQYLAYYPAKLFLHGEEMTRAELWGGIGAELAVTVGLLLAVRVAYRRGLRHYSAFGG